MLFRYQAHALSSCALACAACALMLVGCGALTGIDDFKAAAKKPDAQTGLDAAGCNTHADCAGKRQADYPASFCEKSSHRCVALKSVDCTKLTGPIEDERAVLLGSLFATTGAQASVNQAREQSAMLAIEELNAAGGLPSRSAGDQPHPLVLISCDASSAPLRAAEHLVNDLNVPAIVGPNNSQNTLDIAQKVSIPGGTVSLSPTAVAASIAELRDEDLAFQMVPHDVQRGPLLLHELGETERALRAERGRDLKLAVIVRNDALGDGTRASLASLTWNGESLADAVGRGTNAKIDEYAADSSVNPELVTRYVDYAPDVVVLIGAAEAVRGMMAPLERAWKTEKGPKPQYLAIDSLKVPELLSLVEELPELAARVRGTGITPSPQSTPVNQAFLLSYTARYPDSDQATSSGVGPSYDATYALAYAMTSAGGTASGPDVARGLRRLSGGEAIRVGPSQIQAAFRRLATGQPIDAIGTYSRLAWDDRGAISAGNLEIWCVEVLSGRAAFTSSGLTADIPSQALHGDNARCGLRRSTEAKPTTSAMGASTQAQPSAAGAPAPPTSKPMPVAGAASPGAGTKDPGAGGRAGMAATGGGGASAPPPALPVPCGPLQCERSAGEYCCVSQLRLANYSDDYSCETSPKSCATSLRCSSDRECDHGAICCLNDQRESYCSANNSCRSGELHIACNKPDDCGSGQRCCTEGSDPAALMATTCAPRCKDVTEGSLEMCTRQSQCNSPNGCQWKPFFGALGICL